MVDTRQKRMAEFIEPFLVKPDSRVSLPNDSDTARKGGIEKKGERVAGSTKAMGRV
jgi:hypothetical protein